MVRRMSSGLLAGVVLLVLGGCGGQQAGVETPVASPTTQVNPTSITVDIPMTPQPRPTLVPYCEVIGAGKVCNEFLTFWNLGGGLARYGPPISEPFYEVSEQDGNTYLVQYFTNSMIALARAGASNYIGSGFVLVHTRLGSIIYNRKYPGGAPNQKVSSGKGGIDFGQYRLDGAFLRFWSNTFGGKAMDGSELYGNPISNEFAEKNEIISKLFTVQYFEDAAFEAHPENMPPDDVQFVPLGQYELNYRYPKGIPNNATPTPRPYVTPESGYGCWRSADMPDATSKPTVPLADAEKAAREHFEQVQRTSPAASIAGTLGEIASSRYINVDISGPTSDMAFYRDAWYLSFTRLPDKPSPGTTYRFFVFIDGATGQVLPGCDGFIDGMT